MRTTAQVIASLTNLARMSPLTTVPYNPLNAEYNIGVGLAVESMRRHMTDEGWQIFEGLQSAGFCLVGHGLEDSSTSIPDILDRYRPTTVVVQDKREWDVQPRDFRDPAARFTGVEALRERPDIFKLTIVKDAHHSPPYHRSSADSIGCHAWIVYYHPDIVCHLAPYLRREHVIRTYHTVDPSVVPCYTAAGRRGCLLSGATGRGVYPLRERLVTKRQYLPEVTYLPHPGYHRQGNATPQFLQTLSQHKVAICTASIYGYALRKIIEATVCGCVVVTDLPVDDVLPEIDGNLVRVDSDTPYKPICNILRGLYESYDEARQQDFAERALAYYAYDTMGVRLASQIEEMRSSYTCYK